MHGSLATKLRVLRAERGLTVRQVAELSGVAKETISQIERGERHPYDRTLAKLARAYDVPIQDLLEEEATSGKAPAPSSGLPSEAPSESGATGPDTGESGLTLGRLQMPELGSLTLERLHDLGIPAAAEDVDVINRLLAAAEARGVRDELLRELAG